MYGQIWKLTGKVLVTMASDTSLVQKMEDAQITTWPGHCNTHCFLGTYNKDNNTEWRVVKNISSYILSLEVNANPKKI